MKSHGHSPLGSIKDRVDDVGFEHFSVLPHIQYNGTDKPNTFFDLIIGARSQMRGHRAMQGGLAGPRCKDRWTKRGGKLGLFQFLKHNKATLTYAMLVRHQFTNRITKLPTKAKREITRSKA